MWSKIGERITSKRLWPEPIYYRLRQTWCSPIIPIERTETRLKFLYNLKVVYYDIFRNARKMRVIYDAIDMKLRAWMKQTTFRQYLTEGTLTGPLFLVKNYNCLQVIWYEWSSLLLKKTKWVEFGCNNVLIWLLILPINNFKWNSRPHASLSTWDDLSLPDGCQSAFLTCARFSPFVIFLIRNRDLWRSYTLMNFLVPTSKATKSLSRSCKSLTIVQSAWRDCIWLRTTDVSK